MSLGCGSSSRSTLLSSLFHAWSTTKTRPSIFRHSSRKNITIQRCFQSNSTLPSRTLHVETLTGKNNDSILFLHGLLGQGRNLKSFAKQVCALTDRSGHLMDLPGHGKSRISSEEQQQEQQNSYSFASCVNDVAHTVALKKLSCRTLIGHSWGGRMALQYAYQHMESIDRVYLLDVVPGKANDSVERVVDIVSELQHAKIGSKKELVQQLTEQEGLDMGTAQWLASSYVGPGDFGFDLKIVQDILPEFGTQDFDGMLRALLESNIKVDLIRGGKNKAWEIGTLNQLESVKKQYPALFGSHVLPKAGHWVHVDDLKGLVAIVTAT